MRILLLAGGTSPERDVSLRSAASVQIALEQADHSVTLVNPADDLAHADFKHCDVIFPVLHGEGGEDGVLQALLENLGHQNFVGSGSAASMRCYDKWRYKQFLDSIGVKNPVSALVDAEALVGHPLTQTPFVLKPHDGGSSIDTFMIRNIATADLVAMQDACRRHGTMLLEELIEGTEITVGVVDDESLPVIEIVPPAGGEFDYTNKYNGRSQELCPPLSVTSDIQQAAQQLALHIHQQTGCRDFSRTDMIIAADNSLYVLETNTIPGITDESLLPKAAAVAGLGMTDLCVRLAELAASRA